MSHERILLVEDNPVEAYALTRVLVPQGYTVLDASDAREAMQRLRTDQPRLVLLDIGLPPKDVFATPKWDGLDFVKWMQSMGGAAIPIIVLSGMPAGEVRQRLGDFRVTACYEKPVPPQELLTAIRAALDQKQAPPVAEACRF